MIMIKWRDYAWGTCHITRQDKRALMHAFRLIKWLL